MIYAELAIAFARIEAMEGMLAQAESSVEPIPREALFLASRDFNGPGVEAPGFNHAYPG